MHAYVLLLTGLSALRLMLQKGEKKILRQKMSSEKGVSESVNQISAKGNWTMFMFSDSKLISIIY